MKNGTKKLLSVLLAALMSVSSMATFAAAEEDDDGDVRHEHIERENDDEGGHKEKKERPVRESREKNEPAAFSAAPMMLMYSPAPMDDESEPTVRIGDVELADGDYLASNGEETLDEAPASGGYAYFAVVEDVSTLTLNNFEYSYYDYIDAKDLISSANDLTIQLVAGTQNVLNSSNSSIYVEDGDLAITGSGKLEIHAENADGIFVSAKYDDANNYISEGYITISGAELDITTDYNRHPYAGIYAADVTINESSNVEITSNCSGIYSYKNDVSITDSDVIIDSYYAGIDALGDVSITDSDVIIDSYYAGIDALGDVSITGSSFVAAACETLRALVCDALDRSDNLEVLYQNADNINDARIVCIGSKDIDHEHNFDDVRYNTEYHWFLCSNDGCYLPKTRTFSPHSGAHEDSNRDSICDDCGEEYSDLVVDNVFLSDGEYLSNDGVIYTEDDEDKPESGYAHYDEDTNTLTLHNFEYEGVGYEYDEYYDKYYDEYYYEYALIFCDGDLNIVLEGDNILRTPSNDYYHYFSGIIADNVTLSGTENTVPDTLSIDAGEAGITADNVTIRNIEITVISDEDDAIETSGNVTIENSTVTLSSDNEEAIDNDTDGGSVSVTDSKLTITAEDDGIECDGGSIDIRNSEIIITSDNSALDAGTFIRSTNSTYKVTTVTDPAFMAGEGIEIDNLPNDVSVGTVTVEEEVYDEETGGYIPADVIYYTLVNEDGEPLTDVEVEPEEKQESPLASLNLKKLAVTVNGKTRILPGALGSRRTLKFEPEEGYRIADVIVNGKSVGAVEKYTVVITRDLTIDVICEEIEE